MLIPTSERSPWWDLAIVVAPALIAASAILIPWWFDRHSSRATFSICGNTTAWPTRTAIAGGQSSP